MAQMDYIVETRKSFNDAVQAVEAESVAKSFGVLHTHDGHDDFGGEGLPARTTQDH